MSIFLCEDGGLDHPASQEIPMSVIKREVLIKRHPCCAFACFANAHQSSTIACFSIMLFYHAFLSGMLFSLALICRDAHEVEMILLPTKVFGVPNPQLCTLSQLLSRAQPCTEGSVESKQGCLPAK